MAESLLPARLYLSRNSARSSIHFFDLDQFPMSFYSPSPVVTFTCLHDGANGFSDLRGATTWGPTCPCSGGSPGLGWYISPTAIPTSRGPAKSSARSSRIPLNRTSPRSCCAFSACANCGTKKHRCAVTDAELIFRNQARSRFKGKMSILYAAGAWGWSAQRPSGEPLDRNDRGRWSALRNREALSFASSGRATDGGQVK